MPDRDIVHSRLNRRYQAAYREICEGVQSPDQVARDVMTQVRRDLIDYGPAPLQLISQVALLLTDTQPQLPFVNWEDVSSQIDQLARRIDCRNKRGMNLAERACKQVKQRIRHGAQVDDCELEIHRAYIEGVADANFFEHAPLSPQHYNGVDHLTFKMRLEEVRIPANRYGDRFAVQLQRNRDPAKLRLPKSRKPSLDLETNLIERFEA